GVVATNFWAGANWLRFGNCFVGFADDVARARFARAGRGGRGAATAEGARRGMLGTLWHAVEEFVESHHAGSTAEDVMADFAFDVDHQLIEQLEGFCFVFDKRIALAVLAQADTLAQTIHRIEMFLPEFIDGA